MLIFDGSDASVKQNHVHLDEIEKLIAKGVRLYSRDGLHAKMIWVETKPPVAFIGSANASRTSAEDLSEAVVAFDDPTAVQDVQLTLSMWQAPAAEVDNDWLRHARALPRQPVRSGSKWRRHATRPIARSDRRMLIDWYEPDSVDPDDGVVEQIAEIERLSDVLIHAVHEEELALSATAEPGESILLIPFQGLKKWTRANARVEEPYQFMRHAENTDGTRFSLLAYRQSPEVRRWDQIDTALFEAGWDDQPGWLTDTQRDAIVALFGSGSADVTAQPG